MLGLFDRTVTRKTRNPLYSLAVAGAGFTVGAEGSNTINVGVALKDRHSQTIGVRGHVQGYLSTDATGDTPVADWNLPSALAIGTNGVLLPASYPATALLTIGTLAIHSTPEQFKTTTTALYRIAAAQYSKAAATALTFTAAHTVTASKFGCILVQVNAAGTVSTKVVSATQAHNTAALALAALPAPDAGNVALGYIAIANNAGDWVANTDDLTNGSDLTTATFVDGPANGGTPVSFGLVSEATGLVDVNITDVRVRSFYLCLRLPDGTLSVSPAVAFV